MSQYVQFFVRSENGAYTEVAWYSRSSEMYQYVSCAPYEKIQHIGSQFFEDMYSKFESHINFLKANIEQTQQMIEYIIKFSDISMSERLTQISEYQEIISDYQDDINSSYMMMGEVLLLQRLAEDDNMYVGVEVGSTPTDDDIVDK